MHDEDLRTKVIRSGLVIHNIEDAQQYLCNLNLESFSNVVGILPIERMPVIEFIGQRVTSLNVTNVHEHTVAFMGTSYGRLKKVVLSSRAREYSEIVVHDGKAILPDMAFDSSKEHIYLMTTTNITKVAVENCRQYGTCSECLNDGDPYCGWCSLEKRRQQNDWTIATSHAVCQRYENCMMSYNDDKGMLAADLSVYWGNNFYLESTKGLSALLYKCGVLANKECSLCMNLNYTRPYLECFWDTLTAESVVCETTRVWRAEPMSPIMLYFDGARITLDRDFIYRPDPIIDSIKPLESIRDFLDHFPTEEENGIAQPGVFSQRLLRSKRAVPIEAQLGFIMDGVLSVRNLSGVIGLDSQLKYYPNPRIFNFSEPDMLKVFKGEMLIIEVKVNNMRYQVGRVEYDVPETFSFPMEAIAGIAAGGGFLLLVIVLILIIYRRQSTRAERIYHKLQIQLDNLESNVRNECKQAFAELQTDMTDLTGDLVSSGIPFWDYHTYTFKVLFPGLTNHVILHPPLRKNGQFQFSDQGLQLFHQLLNKKIFLLTFIRTLEAQRTFSIRDSILKALLVDLVQKSVAGRHPKLMLRRSESVVEKLLTNWLSLCLYKHLKDHAGSSLFMLYKAIKLQVEKGPVDYVTGDARYSLSEDRLLREKIEPRSLTLNVEHGVEVVQIRVLDCDTITQVKEKLLDHLFKNIPCSQRPCMEDLELEWRNGPTGPLTLADEDIASWNRDGWRRLNTLGYYKVHDGTLDHALMSMSSQYPMMKTDSDNTRIWHLGTLQKYIDDLFKTVLSAGCVPPIVKFLFDFLDQEALRYGITDPEVVHTWKCNSLPLRFWVNIIKNPDFVFDINKPLIVDSCLSVVGQTFMDSCSTSEHRLGKDSPSNKLLFAKDIVHYRKLVEKYYADIRDMPPISDQDINTYLADVSRMCSGKFYISSALRELYSFASKFSNELLEDLEQDNQANAQQMSAKLGHVITAMEGPSARMAYV
nr:hypothetical protein BaRGS_027831 [Batillaria attramentaria]